MSDIPSEVVREILLRLPGKSLLRLRCVCKDWRCVIDDPSFIRFHANNQLSSTTLLIEAARGQFYFGFPESLKFPDQARLMDATPIHCGMPLMVANLRLEGSIVSLAPCNGLILMVDSNRIIKTASWLIANLLTRKCHEMPRPTLLADKNNYIFRGHGFGYDYDTDDYKVVMIDKNLTSQIYSLKSDSWRIIGDCPYHDVYTGAGTFLNGALHWYSGDDRIIVLDVGTEDYHLLSPPPIPNRVRNSYRLHLEALSGHLFFFDHGYGGRYDGWVMNDYGVENSWTKLFSIEIPHIFACPVAYFEREKHVLMQHRYGFYWIDIESASTKKVTVNGVSRIAYAHLCTQSLFPLDRRY